MSEGVSLIQATEFDAERLAELSKLAFDTDVEVGAPGEGAPRATMTRSGRPAQ